MSGQIQMGVIGQLAFYLALLISEIRAALTVGMCVLNFLAIAAVVSAGEKAAQGNTGGQALGLAFALVVLVVAFTTDQRVVARLLARGDDAERVAAAGDVTPEQLAEAQKRVNEARADVKPFESALASVQAGFDRESRLAEAEAGRGSCGPICQGHQEQARVLLAAVGDAKAELATARADLKEAKSDLRKLEAAAREPDPRSDEALVAGLPEWARMVLLWVAPAAIEFGALFGGALYGYRRARADDGPVSEARMREMMAEVMRGASALPQPMPRAASGMAPPFTKRLRDGPPMSERRRPVGGIELDPNTQAELHRPPPTPEEKRMNGVAPEAAPHTPPRASIEGGGPLLEG